MYKLKCLQSSLSVNWSPNPNQHNSTETEYIQIERLILRGAGLFLGPLAAASKRSKFCTVGWGLMVAIAIGIFNSQKAAWKIRRFYKGISCPEICPTQPQTLNVYVFTSFYAIVCNMWRP